MLSTLYHFLYHFPFLLLPVLPFPLPTSSSLFSSLFNSLNPQCSGHSLVRNTLMVFHLVHQKSLSLCNCLQDPMHNYTFPHWLPLCPHSTPQPPSLGSSLTDSLMLLGDLKSVLASELLHLLIPLPALPSTTMCWLESSQHMQTAISLTTLKNWSSYSYVRRISCSAFFPLHSPCHLPIYHAIYLFSFIAGLSTLKYKAWILPLWFSAVCSAHYSSAWL